MAKSYDLVIRGGRLIDGTGAPARKADIGIRGETIADIGELAPAVETPILEASGLTVVPGFIDAWAAADPLAPAFPGAETKLLQGVTSEVAGAGSRFPFPLADGAALPLEKFEVDLIAPDWTDAKGYLLRLARAGTGVNRAFMAGYGQIRSAVLGPSDSRPTRDEARRISKELTAALDAGCIGMSVDMSSPPGSFAGAEQIVELARVLAEADACLALTLRDYGAKLEEAVEEALLISKRAGVNLILPSLRIGPADHWPKMDWLERTLTRAVEDDGLELTVTAEPYSAWLGPLMSLLPAELRAGSPSTTVSLLRSPRQRELAIATLALRASAGPEYWTRVLLLDLLPNQARTGSGRFVALKDDGTAQPVPMPRHTTRPVSDVAAERNREPLETVLELIEENPLRQAMFYEMSEGNVERILAMDFACIGSAEPARPLDDPRAAPSPHPRGLGAFPRLLRRYAREKELLTPEEAVRRITSLPASRFKLAGRGVVSSGAFADLALLRMDAVSDCATFGNPAAPPKGIEYVLIGGRVAVRNGEPTGVRPGRVLRR